MLWRLVHSQHISTLECYGKGQCVLKHSIRTEVSWIQSDLLTGLPDILITANDISPYLYLRVPISYCGVPSDLRHDCKVDQ